MQHACTHAARNRCTCVACGPDHHHHHHYHRVTAPPYTANHDRAHFHRPSEPIPTRRMIRRTSLAYTRVLQQIHRTASTPPYYTPPYTAIHAMHTRIMHETAAVRVIVAHEYTIQNVTIETKRSNKDRRKKKAKRSKSYPPKLEKAARFSYSVKRSELRSGPIKDSIRRDSKNETGFAGRVKASFDLIY